MGVTQGSDMVYFTFKNVLLVGVWGLDHWKWSQYSKWERPEAWIAEDAEEGRCRCIWVCFEDASDRVCFSL